jgi:hypothetical protein
MLFDELIQYRMFRLVPAVGSGWSRRCKRLDRHR